MSKYIIELGEDANMVQVISVTQSGNAYIDSTVYVGHLEQLNSDYINEHFGDLQDTAYQRGFEKGKDVRIKGCEGCMYQDTTIEHNPCNLCCNAFLNRWTAKQKADDEIKVGDEVKRKNTPESERGGIVTKDWENSYYIMWTDGSSGQWDKDRVVKTGRHFDVDKILEEMRT